MANELTITPPPVPEAKPAPPADDLAVDRAFVMSMARVPFIAIGWAVAAFAADRLWAAAGITGLPNFGTLVVLCFGMVLAAWIDGYAFKVPNWLTLSLTVSGWYVGLLHDFGVEGAGQGGVGYALLGTAIGFAALFPALFIGGMGQGDVKMTMGFGSWCGAFFGRGFELPSGDTVSGPAVIWWAFALGVIVGGVFGIVMMALRRQFHKNVQNFRAIALDLQTLVTQGPGKASERANSRRQDWVRLPYGVPLCVGFLGYLWYRLFLVG